MTSYLHYAVNPLLILNAHPAQVLEVCQEVTELDLTDWKSRIEGKGGAEVLPEVKLFYIIKQGLRERVGPRFFLR